MFSGNKMNKSKAWIETNWKQIIFLLNPFEFINRMIVCVRRTNQMLLRRTQCSKFCCWGLKKLFCPDLQLPVTWLRGTSTIHPFCPPSSPLLLHLSLMSLPWQRTKSDGSAPDLGGLCRQSWKDFLMSTCRGQFITALPTPVVKRVATAGWRASCTQSLEPSATLQSVWTLWLPPTTPPLPPPAYTTSVLHQHISEVGAVWLKLEGKLSYGSASG